MKIAVYAISKNEEQFVDRFCASAADADLVLIGDTGSTDDTVNRALRHPNVIVQEICVRPWRFDIARDTVLSLIPGEYDVCVSLDLDEVLQLGWRQEIERVWKENTTRLRLAVKEDPHCPRNAFYFARELTFYSKWGEAAVALLKYLDNPQATWPNERCYAMRLLGKAYDALQQPDEALEWYRKACSEAPTTREPWHDVALAYHNKKDWAACLMAAEKGLTIKDKQLVYTCDPRVWEEPLHDLASVAAWNLGFKDEALAYCETAAKMAPSDARIAANLKMMQLEPENAGA